MGFIASILVALPIAVGLAKSRFLSRALYPLLVVIQSVPVIAVAPIIIVVLGTDDAPRVVITFMISFFPLVVSMTTGLTATPPELIELSRSLRAPVPRESTQIRLPHSIPYIFSGLKISITLAVIGAVVSEVVAADKGIGYFILFSTSMFKLPQARAGLGSGIAPADALHAAGGTVSPAVDGAGANEAADMGAELHTTFACHRATKGVAAARAETVLHWATMGGAKALGFAKLGQLAPGMAADITLFDLSAPCNLGLHDPAVAPIVTGATTVRHSLVGGRPLVVDGQAPRIDLAALAEDAARITARLKQAHADILSNARHWAEA